MTATPVSATSETCVSDIRSNGAWARRSTPHRATVTAPDAVDTCAATVSPWLWAAATRASIVGTSREGMLSMVPDPSS